MSTYKKNSQYAKFCSYGFLKNLRFFDAFFILFLLEKGISYSQIGILYAVREVFINIFEIPSGLIADTSGRKRALAFSFIAYIISFLVFYISGDFWLFLLAFILYGLGDAFRSGTHKGMIMDYLKMNNWEDHKIDYYGHTRSWSQLGSALSSLIAGFLVFRSGNYENVFLYSIIPYMMNFFLILSYPAELNRKPGSGGLRLNLKKTFKTFFTTLKKPVVLKIANSAAVHSAYLKAVKDYIQPLLLQVTIIVPLLMELDKEKRSGLFIGIIYFIIFILSSLASRSSSFLERKHFRNAAYITLVLGFSMGIISGLLYHKEVWIIAMFFFIAIYIIENLRKPLLTGFMSDAVSNEILTSVMSAQSQLKTIMTAILALVFGFIAERFDIGLALVITSGSLLLVTFLLLFTGRKKTDPVN